MNNDNNGGCHTVTVSHSVCIMLMTPQSIADDIINALRDVTIVTDAYSDF